MSRATNPLWAAPKDLYKLYREEAFWDPPEKIEGKYRNAWAMLIKVLTDKKMGKKSIKDISKVAHKDAEILKKAKAMVVKFNSQHDQVTKSEAEGDAGDELRIESNFSDTERAALRKGVRKTFGEAMTIMDFLEEVSGISDPGRQESL